jgi:transposase
VNTKQGLSPGRQRRRYSLEFKAKLVEECRRAGVSLASIALANGLNANLLRRWVVEHEALAAPAPQPPTAAPNADFVALPLIAGPPAPPTADIRIEVRRGSATVTVSWPAQAAGDCAAWLREWLR